MERSKTLSFRGLLFYLLLPGHFQELEAGVSLGAFVGIQGKTVSLRQNMENV